jgi:sugar-specific transcriptional regulator TrmB
MSVHDAVEALQELGLSTYEAKVFVALQRLGTGTAQEVNRVSEVPRSQVYGAADDLAARGLVEVVESSPKAYRPVSLAVARERLAARVEREQARAFENLEAIEGERGSTTDEGTVSTLRGEAAIRDRLVSLVADSEKQVVLVGATTDLLTDDVVATVEERAAAGVVVVLVSKDPAVADHFAGSAVRVMDVPESHHGGFMGRTLLVDDDTVLLAVPTDEDHPEPVDEVALWTADTSIGHILARFIHAGMQRGMDEYPGEFTGDNSGADSGADSDAPGE